MTPARSQVHGMPLRNVKCSPNRLGMARQAECRLVVLGPDESSPASDEGELGNQLVGGDGDGAAHRDGARRR